MTVVNQLAR
jgi:hypothetical protein